jgi:amidase
VIRVGKERRVYALAADTPPVVTVTPGAIVRLETADCFADQLRSPDDALTAVDWDDINPATGPVRVEAAEAGDVLVVHVERIELADQGLMAVGPGFGVLADRIAAFEWRRVPIRDGTAAFADGVALPVRPMIGVVGVAPAGTPVPTGTPGAHGGNMDTRLIGEGATLYLPVFVSGALLAAGDLHAVMGDGEICGTGVEVAGAVTLRLEVRRDMRLRNPVVRTADVVATIASAQTLDEAASMATRDMADLLEERLGLSASTATMLMSAAGELQVSQVVDPLKTARFVMRHRVLAGFGSPLL